jgi:thiol:disulfide interchange protein DsbA
MKKTGILSLLILGLAIFLAAPTAQAQPAAYQEGLHYFEIEQAPVRSSGEMELVEAFSYLCTHCNTFEPYINNWVKRKPENVEFRRIPVIFGRQSWELYARGYVTAEMMGIVEETHGAMMDAIWKEKNIMRDMSQLAEFYGKFGVEAGEFEATAKSFAVDAKMRKDQRLVQSYLVRGTPTLVLNGKYRIAGSEAVPNYEVMLDVVDFLIAAETAEVETAAEAEAPAETEES